MRTRTLWTVSLILLVAVTLSAAKGDKAKYLGGTLTSIAENTDFEFDTNGESVALLLWKKHKNNPAGKLEVPYKTIESIEYGQKAGRRVGVAIAISPLALFSKKRKHYLTIGYQDADSKPQGIVIEIPKGTAKKMITILEVRSGKKVEYESEEAKKHVHG